MFRFSFLIFMLLMISCKREVPQSMDTERKQESKKEPKELKKDFYSVDYVLGKFDPSSAKDFVAIPKSYADRAGMFMRKEAFMAFEKMHTAAKKDGVDLVIRSAARNFNYQKGIWERKWNGQRILSDGTNASEVSDEVARALKILEYSAMPGSSRHHWGTDIDLNSFDNEWFEKGDGLKVYNWLKANAERYGYCQVYCEKGALRKSGYNEEKWHYSYMPESHGLLNFAKEELKIKDIHGFAGDHTAAEVDIINKYILGVNSSCQH